jgi:hypothetical protein
MYRAIAGQPYYTHVSDAHIFGCNSGAIPRILRLQLQLNQKMTEPIFWHVDLPAELPALYGPDARLVIDLKPNNSSELALYELLDVWGHSESGWTPAMFRLRGLIVDGTKADLSDKQFIPHKDDFHKNIYSFVYFAGTIRQGALIGAWTAPRASPTNSALLWPETLRHFVKCIRTATPDVLADA